MPKTSFISKTLFWTLIPALLWLGLFAARPWLYHAWCAVQPTPCTWENVNFFDRQALQFRSLLADFLSNLVQNTVAVVLFILPILVIRDAKILVKLISFLLYGTLWNGAALELTRALVQRPRPLVMTDPMGDGANINQYTSFYSGHTSFVAYATLMSALWIRSRFGKSHFYTKMAWMSWIGITLLTATLRILGGRHYPTDTMVGTVAGTCIAFVTWWYYATSVEIYSLPTMQSK